MYHTHTQGVIPLSGRQAQLEARTSVNLGSVLQYAPIPAGLVIVSNRGSATVHRDGSVDGEVRWDRIGIGLRRMG